MTTPVPGFSNIESAVTPLPPTVDATVVWVQLRVRPAEEARFLLAAATVAERSLADEVGCWQYDVVSLGTDSCLYGIYEVYADEVALAAHRTAPHYAEWDAVAPSFFEEGGVCVRVGVRMIPPSAAFSRD